MLHDVIVMGRDHTKSSTYSAGVVLSRGVPASRSGALCVRLRMPYSVYSERYVYNTAVTKTAESLRRGGTYSKATLSQPTLHSTVAFKLFWGKAILRKGG